MWLVTLAMGTTSTADEAANTAEAANVTANTASLWTCAAVCCLFSERDADHNATRRRSCDLK